MSYDLFLDEAIQNLPENYRTDFATQICRITPDCLVAANPNYAPIIYRNENRKWEEIQLEDRQDPPIGKALFNL